LEFLFQYILKQKHFKLSGLQESDVITLTRIPSTWLATKIKISLKR